MPAEKEKKGKEDKSKVHKLSLKGELLGCENVVAMARARASGTEDKSMPCRFAWVAKVSWIVC